MTDQAALARKTLVSESVKQVGEPVTEKLAKDDVNRKLKVGESVTTTRFTKAYTDGSTTKESVLAITGVDGATREVKKLDEITLGTGPAVIMTMLVFVQVLYVTMVYGPIAAFLVELFPARIRYTSMSLPYHIGNGVFGGLVPFIGTAAVAATGNRFAGLWYPMAIATLTLVVGTLLIKEKRNVRMHDEH
jgi:hypothetical protein